MSQVQYKLVNTEEDGSVATVVVRGKGTFLAHSSHPNFEAILQGAIAQDESVVDLFDLSLTAGAYLEPLSDRVSVAHGQVYFDGEIVADALTTQIIRFLDEDVEDWVPLVKFFEKVQQNPNEHSREHLYRWLVGDPDDSNYEPRGFTITENGDFVAYKGVENAPANAPGPYQSVTEGTAIVDGEVFVGKIPNYEEAIVEMPRNQVTFDPAESCSTGLHVGTYSYAEGWARGAMLEVHINPRGGGSVPTESNGQKMRVCRYLVKGIIDAPHTVPVVSYYETDSESDDEDFCNEEYCGYCGDFVDNCGECNFEPEFEDWHEEMREEVRQEIRDEDGLISLVVEPLSRADAVGVVVGDVFEDADSRRRGRMFTVEAIEGDYAYGMSEGDKGSRARKVRLDRLTSRKYRRV